MFRQQIQRKEYLTYYMLVQGLLSILTTKELSFLREIKGLISLSSCRTQLTSTKNAVVVHQLKLTPPS
jgi:hypothetical protein